jgi:hypothetical protein
MIGTVISADMDLVGQLQPHQTAQFEKVTREQALAAREERRSERQAADAARLIAGSLASGSASSTAAGKPPLRRRKLG